jgi:Uma2 family endonuclease
MNEHVAAKAGRATYQDVLDAPEHMVAELIRGALHLHPRPASPHARASSMLGVEVGGPFDRGRGGPGGWWIIDEPELHLGEDVLVPDLAGWRRERMPAYPDVPHFTIAPDWVCEVLSPSTRRVDLIEKREIYGVSGVGHLWFVDPIDRTLEVFARRDGGWILVTAIRDDAEVRAVPFEVVGFPLSALWAGEAP